MAHISLHLHPSLLSPPGSRNGSSRNAEMRNDLSQPRPFLLNVPSPSGSPHLTFEGGTAHGWRSGCSGCSGTSVGIAAPSAGSDAARRLFGPE